MASVIKTDHPGRTVIHTWDLTSADATGDAISVPGSSDRTVQFIIDTSGSAIAVLEGSLDGIAFFTLTDSQGNDISTKADTGEKVEENTLWIRPRLSTAGSGAKWSCLFFSRSAMR